MESWRNHYQESGNDYDSWVFVRNGLLPGGFFLALTLKEYTANQVGPNGSNKGRRKSSQQNKRLRKTSCHVASALVFLALKYKSSHVFGGEPLPHKPVILQKADTNGGASGPPWMIYSGGSSKGWWWYFDMVQKLWVSTTSHAPKDPRYPYVQKRIFHTLKR